MAEQYLPTPENYATPEQLAAQREMSKLLIKDTLPPIRHWTQGLGNMVEALVGGYGLHNAGRQENAMYQKGADSIKRAHPDFDAMSAPPAAPPSRAPAPAAFAPEAAAVSPPPPGKPIQQATEGIEPVSQYADMDTYNPSSIALDRMVPKDVRAGGFDTLKAGMGGPPGASGGPALPFSGDPVNAPGPAPDAPAAIAKALALGATKGPSVPGGPVGPGETIAPVGQRINPDVLPQRPKINPQLFQEMYSNQFLPPEARQWGKDAYFQQNQPMTMPYPGGNVLISPKTGTQQFIPDVHWGTDKTGQIEGQIPQIINPDGSRRALPNAAPPLPEAPPPAAPPRAVPKLNYAGEEESPGMLGVPPPTLPRSGDAAGVRGGEIKMAQVDPETQKKYDWVKKQELDFEGAKEYQNKQIDSFNKTVDKLMDIGVKAKQSTSSLELARQLIEDPKFYSGIAADPIIDLKRIKAALGIDPKSAAANETFGKIIAGNVVKDLTVELQGVGQVRVEEIRLLNRAAANQYNSVAANRAVLTLMLKAHEQAGMIGQISEAYADGYRWDKNGEPIVDKDGNYVVHKGPGNLPTKAGLSAAIGKYLDNHPIATKDEIKEYHKYFDEDAKYKPIKDPGDNRRPTRSVGGEKKGAAVPETQLPRAPVGVPAPEGFGGP